jgi:hypothetical protein
VLSDAINIMQDHITRTRLAGGPPHVILMPRLGDTGLTEFNRAKQAIGESRACVEQAMPMLQRYISKRRQRAVRDEKQSTESNQLDVLFQFRAPRLVRKGRKSIARGYSLRDPTRCRAKRQGHVIKNDV